MPRQKLRNESNPAYILLALAPAETQIARQAFSNRVGIQQLGSVTMLLEFLVNDFGDGAFAGSAQAGKPHNGARNELRVFNGRRCQRFRTGITHESMIKQVRSKRGYFSEGMFFAPPDRGGR